MDERTGQRLRHELAKCRHSKGFRRYPAPLRDEASQYARLRRAQGASATTISRELGVANTTADAWSGADDRKSTVSVETGEARQPTRGKLSLVPVVVRPDPPQRVLSRLELDFSDGTRLQATGIAPEDLARAIELLRGQA